MKAFNTTAVCIPADHYMVDLSERVREIRKMIDEQKFFSINRGRQYGKTTTIAALETDLPSDYDVISIDFQDATEAVLENEDSFTKGFARILCDASDTLGIPLKKQYYNILMDLAEKEKSTTLKSRHSPFFGDRCLLSI